MADWKPHNGGPILDAQPGEWVDVKHRDGSVSLRRQVPARVCPWAHLGTGCDIVAYRPTTPPNDARCLP